MSRAYFCLTHADEGRTMPTLHVNGHELHLSHEEFFRLMTEAVWVAKSINGHKPAAAPRPAYAGYDSDGNYHNI